MDPINTFVDWILSTRFEDLPGEVVERSRIATLDTLGCALAGSGADGIDAILDVARSWRGSGESTVLVHGDKVATSAAVLANCAMARSLDFDDQYEAGGGHLSATSVPACLAIAEKRGAVDGRSFLLAVSLCSEFHGRIRLCLAQGAFRNGGTMTGWMSETFAPFGVAAAYAKLFDLDREQCLNAMGIAYAQCATNGQAQVEGVLTGRLQQGLGAMGGVLAGILAATGFTGVREPFTGYHGIFNLYAKGNYHLPSLLDGLGQSWMLPGISVKPWPTCKSHHVPVDATIQLVREHGISPSEIEDITVVTNKRIYDLHAVGKYEVRTVPEAQFSLPFAVAVAARSGTLTIGAYSPSELHHPEVHAMMQRVTVETDEEFDKIPAMQVPNIVRIRTRRGTFQKRLEVARGNPKNPLSFDDVADKFMECARHSVRTIPIESLDKVVGMVKQIEAVRDVAELVSPLS